MDSEDGLHGPSDPVPARPPLWAGLFRLEPGRPAVAAGLRMMLLIGLPMAIGAATGRLAGATIVSLVAIYGGTANAGMSRRSGWVVLLTLSMLSAVALASGSLIGDRLVLAVPAMFAVAFLSGAANLFGSAPANVGFVVTVLFVVGLSQPASGALVLDRFLLALLGGIWTMMITQVLWPLRPFDDAAREVAGCYRVAADLVGEVAGTVHGAAGSPVRPSSLAGSVTLKVRLPRARAVVSAVRGDRSGASPRARALQSLVDRVAVLGEHAEVLSPPLTTARRTDGTGPGVAAAGSALEAVRRLLVDTAARIEHPEHAGGSDAEGLVQQRLSDLDDLMAELLARGAFHPYSMLRPVVDNVHRLAVAAASAARVAGGRAGGGPEPGWTSEAAPVRRPRRAAPVRRPRRAAPASFGRTVGQNLTLRSAAFRHGVRLGCTAAVGALIVALVPLGRGYWVLVTIAVVMRPYAALTLQRACLRVGGTVMGAVLGAAVLVSVDSSAGLLAILCVLALAAYSLQPLNYGLGVIFLTPMVLVLVSVGQPGDWALAGQRVTDTVIGGALALVGGTLLWPSAERRGVLDELARVEQVLRTFAVQVLDRMLGLSTGDRPALREDAGVSVANAESAFQRLLGDPTTRRAGMAPLWSLAEAQRSAFLSMSALADTLTTEQWDQEGPVVGGPISDAVTEGRRAIDHACRMVGAALEHRRPPADVIPDRRRLAAACAATGEAAARLRQERRRELAGEVELQTPLAHRARVVSACALTLAAMDGALKVMQESAGELSEPPAAHRGEPAGRGR